jgi:hypothetical protein
MGGLKALSMLFLFYHYDTFILSISIAGRSVTYLKTGMAV